jgi:hypothetical protein
MSENNPIPICANMNMRSSCQIPIRSAAADLSDSCSADFCGVQFLFADYFGKR